MRGTLKQEADVKGRVLVIIVGVLFFVGNVDGAFAPRAMAYAEEDHAIGEEQGEAETEENVEQEEKKIIVTATRTNIEEEKVTKSVSVITEEQIERSKVNTVAEALKTLSGVQVKSQGGIGTNTSIGIRGGSPTQTLVLFDGVQSINSPTLGSANLANLFTTGIEQIEVLRGGSSVLYGSSAQAGVVNIITKRGKGKPEIEVMGEYGTRRTFRETIGFSGSLTDEDIHWLSADEVYFASSATRVDSDGIGTQNDYENWYFSNRYGIDLNEHINLDVVNRVYDAMVGTDSSYAPTYEPIGVTDQYFKDRLITIKPELNIDYGIYEGRYSYSGVFQQNYNQPNGSTANKIRTSTNKMDFFNALHLIEKDAVADTLSFGVDTQWDNGKLPGYNESMQLFGLYAQNEVTFWDRVFLVGGVRYLDHDTFGDDVVWSASGAYMHKETGTKLKTSFDQSFRSPTLNDLYYPTEEWFWDGMSVGGARGNIGLQPEEGNHYDIGIEQDLFDSKFFVGATYFYNKYTNMIQWAGDDVTGWWEPTNLASASTRGVELESRWMPVDTFEAWVNYTYVDTKDASRNGKEIWGTPGNTVNLGFNWNGIDRLNVNANISIVSTRQYSGVPYILNSYYKFDCSMSYDITRNFQIFGRIENMLDDSYMENAGYPEPGAMFFIGGKMRFGGE
jgi:vitamin B12 transporter